MTFRAPSPDTLYTWTLYWGQAVEFHAKTDDDLWRMVSDHDGCTPEAFILGCHSHGLDPLRMFNALADIALRHDTDPTKYSWDELKL